MNPPLSIIVPVYNVENYLCQCIDSILNQSYTDFELILVDDGSQDRSREICDRYAFEDKRIIVVHKQNGGLSSARNAGIEISRGKYLSFIDSDDFISEDYYLWNMEYLIDHPQIDILVTQVCYYDNQNTKYIYNEKRVLDTHADIVNYMLSKNYIGSAWINIYKKNIFNNLRFPEGKIYEDGYILTDIIERINKVFISDSGIYYYRKRDNSIITRAKSPKDWIDILDTHLKQLNYCYSLIDNDKKLFINKYEICHRALIYAYIQYPEGKFQKYLDEFESYTFNMKQLIKAQISIRSILKLYILKKSGYKNMVKVYKMCSKLT